MAGKVTRKVKIIATIMLIAMGLHCFPSLAWGYDLFSGKTSNIFTQLSKNTAPVKEKLMQNAAKKATKATKEFAAPTSLWAQNITETSMHIYWNKAENNTGAVEYKLYKDGKLYTTITTRRNAKVTGLSKGVTYTFYVIARDKATGVTKKSKILSQKTTGFVNEATKKAHYASQVKVKNEEINRANNLVDAKFDKMITKPIDARITPQTNKGVKFGYGVIEGIPKGVKDLGCFTYSFLKHTSTRNLHTSSMNAYYKLKDNRETYINTAREKYISAKENPVQTVKTSARIGGTVAGAFYQSGRQYIKEMDSRKLGNLTGELGGIGGGIYKAVGTVKKATSIASKSIKLATKAPTVAKANNKANIFLLAKAPDKGFVTKGVTRLTENKNNFVPSTKLITISTIKEAIEDGKMLPMEECVVRMIAEMAGADYSGVKIRTVKKGRLIKIKKRSMQLQI